MATTASAATTIDRQKVAMEKFGFDALVAYSKENVAYGAGYVVPSQALNVRNRQFAVAVNRDGRAAMLLTSVEQWEAKDRSAVTELYPYDEFSDNPMEVLAQLLRDLGVGSGRIGLEMDAIPADRWEDLRRALPEATFEHGTEAFQFARMVKTPGELESLRAACRAADTAQLEAHAHIHEGMSEQDVYRLIVDRALAAGAEDVVLAQVAAGLRGTYANPAPTETILRRGDVVKVDVFVTKNGYHSDTGRSFVVGEASAEQRDIWAAQQETLACIHAAIRPGIETRDVWEVFSKSFKSRGMEPWIRFLGHGLGLSLHEEPFIAAHSQAVLEPGMVLAIEPVYRTAEAGFHLEDNIVVTERGVENMTSLIGPDLVVVPSTD